MNIYETVTAKLLEALERGSIPWRQPWKPSSKGARIPSNLASGKAYRGINVLLLSCSPYQSREWLTFLQAKERGAHVRKGEKGWPVVFWKFDERADSAGDNKRMAFMRSYTVFNVEQIEGLPADLPFDAPAFDAIEAAEQVKRGYFEQARAPRLYHAGGSAYYSSGPDEVVMPAPHTFKTPEFYYSILFHEMGHSTGHASRLNRPLGNHFGSQDYSKEELIAEFSAAFLCAECGISNEYTETNTTAYLQSWMRVLRSDKTLAVSAAQRAQRAADLILGRIAAEAPAEAEAVAA